MLRKRIIMVSVLAVLVISSAACTNNQTEQAKNSNTSDIVSTAAPKTEKLAKNINAVAEKLRLTGGSVELYQFDEKNDSYTQIINDGIPLEAAAYKDGIILVFPVGTEADNDLVEQFNGIEFK